MLCLSHFVAYSDAIVQKQPKYAANQSNGFITVFKQSQKGVDFGGKIRYFRHPRQIYLETISQYLFSAQHVGTLAFRARALLNLCSPERPRRPPLLRLRIYYVKIILTGPFVESPKPKKDKKINHNFYQRQSKGEHNFARC